MSKIEIIDAIVPKNNGAFPTHIDSYGQGGFQVRNDITDRNSIPALNRKQGMLVATLSDGYYWTLGSSLLDTDWHQASFSAGTSVSVDLNIAGQVSGSTIYYNGTKWVSLPPGIDGYVLTTHASSPPTWAAATTISTLSPLDVTKSTALVGSSSKSAREDHKHNIATDSAISIGATNTEGTSTNLARADHTHSVTDLNISGQTLGDILYFDGTNWVKLAAGKDGYFLQTHASGPMWNSVDGVANSNWLVANWYVNQTSGSDLNDGLTSGTALATIEEFSNRLSPSGEVAFLKQTTTLNITAGTYGNIYINIGSGSLIINADKSSSANIVANTVTNTNILSVTRGEIQTASGVFIDQKRIRVVTGSESGAIAFCTGLNTSSNDGYVSAFLSNSGTQVNITNGDNVVVDSLSVSFSSSSLLTTINSTIIINNVIFSNGCYSSNNTIFNECDFSTGTIILGGGVLQFCSLNNVSLGNGTYSGYGNQFLGTNNTYDSQIFLSSSNVFDDCNAFVGIGVNLNFVNIELIRRTQTVGLIFPVGSKITSTGYLWSGTGAYGTTAIQMDPGSYFSFKILPTVSASNNIYIAGVPFNWSQLPQIVGSTSAEYNTTYTSPPNDINYWTGNHWARLAAGQDGYVLTTHNTSSPPTWASAVATNLNIPGQTQGDTLYYNGTAWTRLAASIDGYVLTTHGTGTAPNWLPAGAANLNIPGQTQGDTLYYDGTSWVRLAAGPDGYFLQTHPSGPSWTKVSFTVANNAALNSIPTNVRSEGMIVYSQNTQCYYELQPDLTTWVFHDSNPALASQATWYVDPTGNDTADGKTLATALATLTELDRRLWPFGRRQNLTNDVFIYINTAAPSAITYPQLLPNVGTDETIADNTVHTLNIIFGKVSSAPIVLSADAIIPIATTNQRGQLATASGTFLDNELIEITSGPGIGGVCYSNGLNGDAQHTFVTGMTVPTLAGAVVGGGHGQDIKPLAGNTCVVTTLVTTVRRLEINCTGLSQVFVQYGCFIRVSISGSSVGTIYAGIGGPVAISCSQQISTGGRWENNSNGAFLFQCRTTRTGKTSMFGVGWCIIGHVIQGILALNGQALSYGLNVDGGQLKIGIGDDNNHPGESVFSKWLLFSSYTNLFSGGSSGSIEFTRGNLIAGGSIYNSSAILVCDGSVLLNTDFNGYLWGNSASGIYDWGVVIMANAYVCQGNISTGVMANVWKIPSTVNIMLDNLAFSFSDNTITIKNSNCGMIGVGYNVNNFYNETDFGLYLTNQSTNLAPAGCSAIRKAGLYKVMGYVATTTADASALGNPCLNIIFTDDSGVSRTVPVASTPSLATLGGNGGEVIIECGSGLVIVNWSITGIGTIGSARYSVRLRVEKDSFGS